MKRTNMENINENIIREAVAAELESLERSPGQDAWSNLVSRLEEQDRIRSKGNRFTARSRILAAAASFVLLLGATWWLTSSVMDKPAEDINRLGIEGDLSGKDDQKGRTFDETGQQYADMIGGFRYAGVMDSFEGKPLPGEVSCFLYKEGERGILLFKSAGAQNIFNLLNYSPGEANPNDFPLIDEISGRTIIIWKESSYFYALYPLDQDISAAGLRDLWESIQR